MAAATQRFDENGGVKRQEIQDAIAKVVELRALHAALVQGGSPTNLRFPSASPVPSHLLHPHFSAQDYPVFTPSYEDEPLPGYKLLQLENQNRGEIWDDHNHLGGATESGNESVLSDRQKPNSSLRNIIADSPHSCPADDQKSFTSQITIPRRNSMADSNKCKPATGRNSSNLVVPLSDSHSPAPSQPKNKGLIFSWLLPRLKRKTKNQSSEDAAMIEAAETKSFIEELRGKLEYLEGYCEELKKALRLAIQTKDSQEAVKLKNLPRIVDSGSPMPVTEEVMLEGFLQVVSEARLSVKHFCKTLLEETDGSLADNLNLLLQPYRLTLSSKYSKAVSYHLEAIINQTLYEDFENCAFQKNGSPKHLNPDQERHSQFSSFVALRNLSWNEVLRKGTKYYSEDFSRFCDQKMSCIITALNWTRPWPEQLLQAFFVSAKCIWLLHLLAFSFCPPLGILRIQENRPFDSHFMDDVFADRQRSQQGPSQVKVMVMPGFYVHDRVLRCKVICRYKSAA